MQKVPLGLAWVSSMLGTPSNQRRMRLSPRKTERY
jgi:hypothetical protein